LAEEFAVAGFVRNLPRGDVELVAEGAAAEVDAFLAAISRRLGGYIEQSFVQEAVPGPYKGFQIRY
jgi:acylphosphatase